MRWTPATFRPGQYLLGAGGAFGGCGELSFVGQSIAVGIGAKITIPYHDGPLAAPTGSPNLSNSGVEPDTPRFPSSRLTAKGVRPKVRRSLRYSGPWLKYHDARPASEFTFFKSLSGRFRRDSMLSPGRILQVLTTCHR